jgi:hypothetical protein
MANIRVLASLEKTASDMKRIKEQVVAYSGIDVKDAARIRAACEEIMESAKKIERIAQKTWESNYQKHWNDPDYDPKRGY